MTAPKPLLDLEAIEARVKAATEGPWEVGGPYPSLSVVFCVDSGSSSPDSPEPPSYEPVCILHDAGPTYREEAYPEQKADAEFIAHARHDVPALVAEVRELREREKGSDVEAHTLFDRACRAEAERDALRSRLEVLEAGKIRGHRIYEKQQARLKAAERLAEALDRLFCACKAGNCPGCERRTDAIAAWRKDATEKKPNHPYEPCLGTRLSHESTWTGKDSFCGPDRCHHHSKETPDCLYPEAAHPKDATESKPAEPVCLECGLPPHKGLNKHGHPIPGTPGAQVGCYNAEGTLNIHLASETCEVCAPPETGKGEA